MLFSFRCQSCNPTAAVGKKSLHVTQQPGPIARHALCSFLQFIILIIQCLHLDPSLFQRYVLKNFGLFEFSMRRVISNSQFPYPGSVFCSLRFLFPLYVLSS